MAANDLVLDGDDTSPDGVIVNEDANLTLNLDLRANSDQPERDGEAGQLEGQYLGDLLVNDRIASGGGAVNLSGANVALDADIDTDGGAVFVLAEGGDATLNATIDTAHTEPGEQGGNVVVAALARVTEDPDDSQRDIVLGGDIHADTDSVIRTGGGSVTLSAGDRLRARRANAVGGNLFFDGSIDSGMGSVRLEAVRALTTSNNGTRLYGGVLEVGDSASIDTDGAAVSLTARVDSGTGGRDDGKTTVRVFGDIDTAADDPDAQGGDVEIRSDGFEFARLEIGDGVAAGAPSITTGGGDVTISSAGSIHFVEGAIDARFTGVQDPDEDAISGDIAIASLGRMSLLAEDTGIALRADDFLRLTAGSDGVHNLRIDTGSAGVTLAADAIEMNAGNGLGSFDISQVDLSRTDEAFQLSNSDGSGNPLELTIAQDADLDTSNLPDGSQFQTGAFELETLTLRSFDGQLELDGLTASASNRMTLGAREGITVDDHTILSADGTLELEVYEAFTVDTALANVINAAGASDLSITAGAIGAQRNVLEEAGLEIAANLVANDSLLLHAGAGGSGDLTFAANPTLTSSDITLWAGDGEITNNLPRVVAVDPDTGAGNVQFDLGGTTGKRFTLRQSATITNETIPLATQFADGVDGLSVSLRSDGGAIGNADAIDASKLQDSFLSVHALAGIEAAYAGGVDDGMLRVRGLDIGGVRDFTYTRNHNDTYDLQDAANETTLVIRAGLSGAGDLDFDGTPGEEDSDEFAIEADEIRLVAGDGLAGGIDSRVILDPNDSNRPIFRDRSDDGDGNAAVRRFVFRQDEAIQETDIAQTDDFFAGTSPLIHVVHSDYDSRFETGAPRTALQFDQAAVVPSASEKLILSGESITVLGETGLDLVEFFEQDPLSDSMTLEIRSDTIDLRATNNNDFDAPVGITLDESRLTLADFERTQPDDAATAPIPAPFDLAMLPDTVPNVVSLFQEADITAAELSKLRTILGSDLTLHDGSADDPDDAPMLLFLESLEGDISLTPSAVEGTDLRITLRDEEAALDFDRSAIYLLENLIVNSDHSLRFGETGIASPLDLDVSAQNLIQVNVGNAGRDAVLDFDESVILRANQIALQAGVNGATADDNEQAAVDITSNTPRFVLKNQADPGDTPDTIFEIRQDAGFVDDLQNADDGETRIADSSQFEGSDEIGLLRLISETGSITIENLSQTFDPVGNGGRVRRLDLQAGTHDPLGRQVLSIEDRSAQDTDLTLFEGVDLSAHEILLAANDMGAVVADDPEIIFRDVPTVFADGLRFAIRHERADICEGADECAAGALPRLDQFANPGGAQAIDYELISTLGAVEITSTIAAKLFTGTNTSPVRTQLSLSGNDIGGDEDVLFHLNRSGRRIDLQLESLVVGEINDDQRIAFANQAGETTAVATVGEQRYFGDVEVNGATDLTGASLFFGADVNSDSGAQLTLNVSERLQLDGDVDLGRNTGTSESSLRVNMDPNAPELVRVSFAADGQRQTIRADHVAFFATEEDDLLKGEGFFPSGARRSTGATLGKASGDLVIDAETFRMSEGEKLSVGGNLSIGDDTTTSVFLGDLSALTIEVIADTITLLLREAGDYFGLDGRIRSDGGVDYVANTISFEGQIETRGSGRPPVFGVHDPFDADPDFARFPVAALTPSNDLLRASDFAPSDTDVVPDLHPEGASRDDFSNIYFGPETVPAPAPWLSAALLPTQNENLARIDIQLEADAPRAIRGRNEGASIIDDVGSDLPDRASSKLRVSTSRMLAHDAEEVAARHVRLFGEDGARTNDVRQVLQRALDGYLAESGARRVLGFEFRRYLRNRPSSQFDAYQVLEDLDALFAYHRNLGLTTGEYTRIQHRWLADIRPEGISIEEFAETVHPSRFVRGSDILDIFGD